MTNDLIDICNLTFSYKKNSDAALKNLSFKVPAKKRVALLGPNGSGKSTLFKVIATQLHNWSGEIYFDGIDLKKNESKVRSKLGVCFQSPSLDKILTAQENLELQSRVLGLDKTQSNIEIKQLSAKL